MSMLRAVRFLLALGARLDRARLTRAVVLMFGGYLAAPLAALVLGRFTDAALAGPGTTATVLAVAAAALLVAQLMLGAFAHLDYFELAEVQEARLREELVDLVNRTPQIDHLDDPRFSDHVSLVRESLASNTRALEAILQLAGLLVQTVITAAILISLDPWFGLLPLFAVPAVLLARRAQAVLERARERTAEAVRQYRHLIDLSTRAGSVKELRLFGVAPAIDRRVRYAWRRVSREVSRGQAVSAAVRVTGHIIFAIGYGGAIVLAMVHAAAGRASVGDVVLVITLAVQVSGQVSSALGLLGVVQAAGRTVERLHELRQLAPAPDASAPRPAVPAVPPPDRLHSGIALRDVTFAYPGSDRAVLQNVSLTVPAGTVLAVVGENGAGKSTLIKLLCGLYTPTAGQVLVDGTDLSTLDIEGWRSRIAPLFQDFLRIEFTLRESVGLGDVPRLADEAVVSGAVAAARADGVLAATSGGLDGYLGRGYADGTDLSGGQWQAVGLARCLMRERPLLLVLDEPAAALDATAEHMLFERYASSASAAARELGGITVLVSHRFSTVLMADTIAVLEAGRLRECGTHRELMAAGGPYAELFALQARAYQPFTIDGQERL